MHEAAASVAAAGGMVNTGWRGWVNERTRETLCDNRRKDEKHEVRGRGRGGGFPLAVTGLCCRGVWSKQDKGLNEVLGNGRCWQG